MRQHPRIVGRRFDSQRNERHFVFLEGYIPASCFNKDPGAGVAALVHQVIYKASVTAHRNSLASRVQVGLSGDGILIVTEVIARISQDLHQRDADVGHVSFAPVRA